MGRASFARWNPDGATPGHAITPRAVIMHCTAGSGDAHPHNGLEWHFEVDYDGNIDQLVDTGLRADANLDANNFAISVEHWGVGDGVLTPEQIAAFLKICHWAHDVHGIPLVRIPTWDGAGIGYHTMWGAPSHWTPVAKSCPGIHRIAQFNTIIIPNLTNPPLEPLEPDMTPAESQLLSDVAAKVNAMWNGKFGDLSFLEQRIGSGVTATTHNVVATLAPGLDAIEKLVKAITPGTSTGSPDAAVAAINKLRADISTALK